ncbi:MAG: extracellular solute-binding protein [Bacillota bacterium]|nr:extracellular solute-binding protein [Bacillota bacterium]
MALRLKAAVLAMVILLSVTLVSCESSQVNVVVPDSTTTKDDKVTIRFISSWGGVDTNADTLQEILDKFNAENPDVNIVNESLFGGDFLPKIKTDFASGNDPDVFGIWPGSDIRTLIDIGKVADLTGVLNSDPIWKDSFNDNMWNFTTYNDKIYGLPFEIIYEGLFVNTDLFKFFHVKIPETYDELLDAANKFYKGNIIPIAYNSSPEGSYIYQNIVAKLGGKQDVEIPFKYKQYNKCFVYAMDYMKDLKKNHAFPTPTNAYTMSDTERNNLFIQKRAAMIVQGSWFIGTVKNDPNVDIVPFPYIKGGQSAKNSLVYGLGNGTFYMSTSAWSDPKKREASIRLLKELTSKNSAYKFAQQTGMLCNIKIDTSMVNYSKLMVKGRQLLSEADELIGPPDHYVDRTIWENTIIKRFPYVLEDKETPQQLWDQAANLYNYGEQEN